MTGAIWPAEFKPLQDSLFQALAEAAGGEARALRFVRIRLKSWPETATRANEALRRAKRQPKTRLGRRLKRALLAGQYNWSRAWFEAHPDTLALAWNGLTGTRRVFLQAATDAGSPRLHCELAPLPGYVTVDPLGVNAEGLAASAEIPPAPEDAEALMAELRQRFVARQSRRADVGQSGTLTNDAPPFVFLPLQVPDDSQMRIFAGWVRDIPGLLDVLGRTAARLPGGWQIRIKEHPSARQSFSRAIGALIAAAPDRIVLDNATDTFELVAKAEAVLTINSSVGFQALFWDKAVIALGQSFWTRPELCTLAHDEAALGRIFGHIADLPRPTAARQAFVAWLAREYLVPVSNGPDGTVLPDAVRLAAKIDQARAFT